MIDMMTEGIIIMNSIIIKVGEMGLRGGGASLLSKRQLGEKRISDKAWFFDIFRVQKKVFSKKIKKVEKRC